MEIRPFRAFRFDESVVGDAGSCIAPPYDVIDPVQQEKLYQKNEYNIVRIIKGKTAASDNQSNNQYTRAADYLKDWIEKGALKQDPTDTIYAYVQDFELNGKEFRRLSFITQARLEPFGEIVKPHEQTLDEHIVDRLNLKRAALAEFGLVFCLYEDSGRVADKIIQTAAEQNPLLDHTDEQNIRHRLGAITARQDIDRIVKMMSDKSCIIADGHHRYTTALAFAKDSAGPAAKYQMLTFANIHQQGLVILPTHRLVNNVENLEPQSLISRLKNNFEITEHKFDSPQGKTKAMLRMLTQIKAEHNSNRNAFGIYCGTGSFCTAVLKDAHIMDSAAPQKSPACRALDVSVLHTLVLEQLLGINEEKLAEGGGLEYIQDSPGATKKLISQVDTKNKQAAFFMNPVSIEQLKAVTAIGERMPQKTTHFYPKVYSGLTVDKL